MRDGNLGMRYNPTTKNCPMTDDENSPFFDPAYVRERDIDRLLLEELVALQVRVAHRGSDTKNPIA
jgi:hypothetical protein